MFITPMQPLGRVDEIKSAGFSQAPVGGTPAPSGASGLFKDFLEDSIKSVVETDEAVKAGTVALATGQIDDLHTLTIDQTKAQLSIELLVQVRNRLLDSYNEIMRINL